MTQYNWLKENINICITHSVKIHVIVKGSKVILHTIQRTTFKNNTFKKGTFTTTLKIKRLKTQMPGTRATSCPGSYLRYPATPLGNTRFVYLTIYLTCFTKRPLRWGTILCLGWLNISELTEKVAVVLLGFASAMIATVSNNVTLFYQKMPLTLKQTLRKH